MATKDRTALKDEFKNGNLATGERFADLIDSMKVVQLPVVDPQALGTSLSFIDSISQDADGKITATKKTLDLANAHELNPFKGWYKTGDTLPTDGFDGAYLYFKDTSEQTGLTTIYRWNGTTYADTGTVVDTSNVQTFGSGQAVNATKIKDESGEEVTGPAGVLSAEAVDVLLQRTNEAVGLAGIAYNMRNGSQGNPGNENVITLYGKDTTAIAVSAGDKIKLKIHKELAAGLHYFYRVFTYTTASPSSLNPSSGIVRKEETFALSHPIDELITIAEGELGLSIVIFASLSDNPSAVSDYYAIRVDDFSDKDIELLNCNNYILNPFEGLDEVPSKVAGLEVAQDYDDYQLKLGSLKVIRGYFENNGEITSSTAVQRAVTEDYYPVYEGQVFHIKAGNYSSIPIVCVYDEQKVFKRAPVVGGSTSTTEVVGTVTIGSGEKYVRLGWYGHIPECDLFGNVKNMVDKYVADKTFLPIKIMQGLVTNGSVGNAGSTTRVCCGWLGELDISDCDYFSIRTNRPNTDGCVYTWQWRTYNNYSDAAASYIRTQENDPYLTDKFPIKTQDGENVLRVAVREWNVEQGVASDVTPSDFEGYYIEVVGYKKDVVIPNVLNLKESYSGNDVYDRNRGKRIPLANACMLNKDNNGSKDVQIAIITDTHAQTLAVSNAVKAANGFPTIDALIHLGDIQASTWVESYAETFISEMQKNEKPWFVCVGNHDVGNTMRIKYAATHEETYNAYIKPMVDAGVLASGEYQENKCYYYHDFDTLKTRLIVLYDYDQPMDTVDCVAENDYWEPITYDDSLPQIAAGTYSVGAEVNCGGFSVCSFRCKQNVTVVAGATPNTGEKTMPTFKVGRGCRIIGSSQAQWIADTMAATPSGYGIIIASHQVAVMVSTNQQGLMFAQKLNWYGNTGDNIEMETDMLYEIIHAYITKASLSVNVAYKSSGSGWHGSSAAYLNTQGSGGNMYAYSVAKNFSSVVGKFLFCINGHTHRDLIMQSDNDTSIYCVNPTCGTTERANSKGSDIRRPYNNVDPSKMDCLEYDAMTVVSGRENRIALVRIGNDRTEEGGYRDYEVINIE